MWNIALAAGLLAAMMACLEAGFLIARHKYSDPSVISEGVGSMDAAAFALLSLLLGFSFSAGMSRLNVRRELIVHEANAIGTAYLRLDLLARDDQQVLRRLFREYLDARISAYQRLPDIEAAEKEFERAAATQRTIWTRAVEASSADTSMVASRLLLPALND